MAQGTAAKKAAAKKAPAKKAVAAPAATADPDPAPDGDENVLSGEEAAAAAGADPEQPTSDDPEDGGLPEGAPGEGKPVGINEHHEVTGGGHAVSVARDAAAPARRRVQKDTVPDGFTEDNGILTATKAISVSFIPAGTIRRSRLLVFPEGSRWAKQAVLDRLALYADREDAELT